MKPLLLSLYDYTETWSRPYINAGWRVLCWDKQIEGNILEAMAYLKVELEEELAGERMGGIIAAPPCTDSSVSGAQWWPEKDKGIRWWKGLNEDSWERTYFETCTDLSICLVHAALVFVEWFKPFFFAIEQPVGRIEKMVPELIPYRKMTFNPCDYGDPYTKRTVLYGEFNTNLTQTPVLPLEGSKIHLVPPGKERANIRSATPPGFARAFYQANHKIEQFKQGYTLPFQTAIKNNRHVQS